MSIKVMSAVWEQDDLDQSETLVMLALADWANDAGHCWPSMAQIARKTRLTERGVRGIIRRLEERGYLLAEEVSGKGVNYYVRPRHYVPPPEKDPPRNVVPPTPERGSANTSLNHHTLELAPTSESNLEHSAKANSKDDHSLFVSEPPPRKIPRRKTAWDPSSEFPDVVPEAWLKWAMENRYWTREQAKHEAQSFVDSALANRRLYADWFAAWRNWCRSKYCKTEKGKPKKPVRIDRW